MPWAKREAGPETEQQLVDLQPSWKTEAQLGEPGRYPAAKLSMIDSFSMTNVSGKELSDVVVELLIENEWKRKAASTITFPC